MDRDQPSHLWLWLCLTAGSLLGSWTSGYDLQKAIQGPYWMGWALIAHWAWPYLLRFVRRGFGLDQQFK